MPVHPSVSSHFEITFPPFSPVRQQLHLAWSHRQSRSHSVCLSPRDGLSFPMHHLHRGNAIPSRYATFYEYRCTAAPWRGIPIVYFLGTVSASGDNAPFLAPGQRTTLERASSAEKRKYTLLKRKLRLAGKSKALWDYGIGVWISILLCIGEINKLLFEALDEAREKV